MSVNRRIRLNLRNFGNLPAIMLSQYDEGYNLVFEIFDGASAAGDLSGYTATLKGVRSDTLSYSFTGTISNNVLTFEIDTTMTGVAGKGTAEIVLTASGVVFATFNMPVFVEKAAVPDGSIDADVERSEELADQIQEIVDTAAEQTTAQAEQIVADLEADVSQIKEDLQDVKDAIITEIVATITFDSTARRQVGGSNGVIQTLDYPAYDSYHVSDYIDVTAGKKYVITASATYQNAIYAWYNSEKTFISCKKSTTGTSTPTTVTDEKVTAPENAAYLLISFISPNTGIVKEYEGVENSWQEDVDALDERMDAIEALTPILGIDVRLTKNGDALTFTDITSGMCLTAGLHDSSNNAFNFYKYYKSNGNDYKNAGDDICPIYYDGSYRCGNHGHLVVIELTASSHGLTEADIGKVYTSADNNDYVLIRIKDTNTLWFVNDSDTRTFITTIPTSPMTYSGSNVAFSNATLKQILPNVNNIEQAITVDGVAITENGTYTGNSIVVRESYYSIDTLAMLSALKNNVGSNTNASYYADTISADLLYETTYTIRKSLQVIVASRIITLRDSVNITAWGVTQSAAIGNRVFVPYTTDAGVWTQTTQKSYLSNTWEDSDFPPNKVYQFNNNDDSMGIAVGYCLDYENGIPSIRKSLCPSHAINLAGTSKLYPLVVSMNVPNAKPKYTVYGGIAVRQLITLTNTLSIVYNIGNTAYVEIDNLVDAVSSVTVPSWLNGRAITTLHKSGSVSVVEAMVSDGTIHICGKGGVSLKLT